MATLKRNGYEIGRTESLLRRFSYRSNGKILVNNGCGWKVAAHNGAQEELDFVREKMRDRKPLADLIEVFSNMFKLSDRRLPWTMLQTLADDPDGLYIELDEHGYAVAPDDVVELCNAYRAWIQFRDSSPTRVYFIDSDGRDQTVAVAVDRRTARSRAKQLVGEIHHPLKLAMADRRVIQAWTLLNNKILPSESNS